MVESPFSKFIQSKHPKTVTNVEPVTEPVTNVEPVTGTVTKPVVEPVIENTVSYDLFEEDTPVVTETRKFKTVGAFVQDYEILARFAKQNNISIAIAFHQLIENTFEEVPK